MNQYTLIPGVNDLATTHPSLAAEWDYEKNEGITPKDVSHGSTKKVWWRCDKGHSYTAVIYSRANGTGCPYCSNNKVLSGFNDLATCAPDLLREWDYERNKGINPTKIAPNTNKKYWWKCDKGHSWKAMAYSRVSGRGCPYCEGRALLKGFNDLATVDPLLAAEFHPTKNGSLTPDQVLAGSHKKYWWKCSLGHEWQATIANREYGTGCPYCSGKKVLKGFNDLATTYPKLAREWDSDKNTDLQPTEVTAGSNRVIWWKCNNGHSWKAAIANRAARNSGCPYCMGTKPVVGENDFASMFPDLMKEWDFKKNAAVDPSHRTWHSRKSVWWICSEGHSWKTEIYNRAHGSGCPFCGKKKDRHRVLPGVNDLQTMEPELAAEWDENRNGELKPTDILPHSTRIVWWECCNGHHWRASPNSRTQGKGCPYCAGKIPLRTRLV